MSVIASALKYHARGWSIIPVRGKKPCLQSWKEFQEARPDEAVVRGWFGNGTANGLAVVLGPVSGGLVCRDFDQMPAYEAWAEAHPDLARKLPTVATGRPGRHVYCRGDVDLIRQASKSGGCIIVFRDGELRGGGYCVLPPSEHPEGPPYRWLVPLGAGVPYVDLVEAGFLHATERTESNRDIGEDRVLQRTAESTEQAETAETAETTEQTENGCVLSVALCCTDLDQIEQAIQESLPKGPGQRNKQVFDLARALKAIPAISEAPARDLLPHVRRWHELAKPNIKTKEFEETWIDFRRAWPKVQFPKGSEPVRRLLDLAMQAGVPEVALKYDGEKCRLLVALCRELARAASNRIFYLSCRTAGELMEVEHTTAWRWLFLFKEEGILEVVSRGSQATGKASRFRYLAPV